LVLVFTLVQAVILPEAGSTATLLAWRPEQPMSYITGITITVGAWSMGAFTIGDYCRYVKKPRAAILGFSAGLLPALLIIHLLGAVFLIITGTTDVTALLNSLGYPAMALVVLIMSAWAINMMNAYSGGIALSVFLGHNEKRLKLNTALTGIIGTVLGAAGILSRFTDFLSLLGSLVPPVIGVLIGVKFSDLFLRLTGRTGLSESPTGILSAAPKMPVGDSPLKPGFHLPGVIAYAVGAMTAWLTGAVYTFFIPPLNGIVIAAAVYVLMNNVFAFKTKE
jgi:cytosine permease